MTLTFVTNLVHHHQIPLADEFYHLLGDDYHYIATQPLPEWLIQGGYDPSLDRSYVIRTYRSEKEMERARLLIDKSDVVIMGDSPLEWANRRNKEGRVTFYCTERIYRKGIPWLKLPWHALVHYLSFGRFKNTYLLCASAYTASDFELTRCFVGKSFKWGYLTAVDVFEKSPKVLNQRKEPIKMMWCARFLLLKHPELPVKLAARLKRKGYSFIIDMYGSGEQLENTRRMIKELCVEDCVDIKGNRPNAVILQEMRQHDIFLFTSDRNEGWGAVLNESMSSGCVPVASDEIGSAPYLINDGINGLMFNSGDINSLENAVCYLLDNPDKINSMSKEALCTMRNVWSPQNAAASFIDLTQYILDGRLNTYCREDGPASWAK